MRLKKSISKSAALYADKLRWKGYYCRINNLGDGSYYNVTVSGPYFNYRTTDFDTPRKAYNFIFGRNQKIKKGKRRR